MQELLFPHPEATNPLLYIYMELQPFHTSQSALTEKNQRQALVWIALSESLEDRHAF